MTRWRDISSKWTGLGKFSFYSEFTDLQWISVLLLKRVSTSISLFTCLGYEHHYSFCVFWVAVQMKSVQLKRLSPWYQLYKQGVAYRVVTWPNDLQTRFCLYTGIPLITLEPHWLMLSPSGVPLACNTLEDLWSHKYTGMPLEPHWLIPAPSGFPVAIQG